MTDELKLAFSDLLNIEKSDPHCPQLIQNSPHDYIVSYVIEYFSDEDKHIVNHQHIPFFCDNDNAMYYSECVKNADVDAIWEVVKENASDIEAGIYNVILFAKCQGSETWTDCGYEYDAWEDYSLISLYRLRDDDIKYQQEDWCWYE